MKKLIIHLPTLMLLLLTQLAFAQVALPDGYTARTNVVYTTVGNWQGLMDIYLPKGNTKAIPLVINIHGGGWVHGRKEDEKGFDVFFKRGYAVANIEYRLAQQAPAPAAIEDARCALMYLVKNATNLHIDKGKIIIMGSSAGGHLALMAGFLQNNHVFDANCPGVNVHIAAVIDKYGPTDLLKWDAMRKPSKASSSWLGGKGDDSLFVKSLSPIYYIGKQTPPVFIAHGDADHTVPYLQSTMLYDKLKAAGIYVEMYTAQGSQHGNFKPQQNEELTEKLSVFLDKIIGKP